MLSNEDLEKSIKFWQRYVENFICGADALRNETGDLLDLTDVNEKASYYIKDITIKLTKSLGKVAKKSCEEGLFRSSVLEGLRGISHFRIWDERGKITLSSAPVQVTAPSDAQHQEVIPIAAETAVKPIRNYAELNGLEAELVLTPSDTSISSLTEELPAHASRNYFSGVSRRAASGDVVKGVSLACSKYAKNFIESSLLGYMNDGSNAEVHINTHEPFCLVAVGVQGSGKSHTLGSILESCIVPYSEIVRLKTPMTTLVLHYDNNAESSCEATGLIQCSPHFLKIIRPYGISPPHLEKSKMIVLVSPSYYKQRQAFYGDYCTVKPLLFRWSTLSADHIKRLMRINDGDNQLYMAGMLDLLRQYQRDMKTPMFEAFIEQLTKLCDVRGQSAPLTQRLNLISSIVAESKLNAMMRAESMDLISACEPGALVIVDLTDPLLSRDDANGIFQVLTEQFRAIPSSQCGKLLALDEAHKFMRGEASDGLSEAIVNAARMMRHDGMRLVVSTQNPSALAPELLELVTVAVMHRFHSRSWFTQLSSKIALSEDCWESIKDLETGDGVVFTAKLQQESYKEGKPSCGVISVRIRERLTADRGSSKTNTLTASPTEALAPQVPMEM